MDVIALVAAAAAVWIAGATAVAVVIGRSIKLRDRAH
jgi:hypothetical protein